MKLTTEQIEALPDLVAFAMVGYAVVANRVEPVPPKKHPKIAPFLDLVGPELDRRERISSLRAALKWGTKEEIDAAAKKCTVAEQHLAIHYPNGRS